METELQPCPFCGSSVELKVLRPGELSVIRCTNHYCYMAYPGSFTSWNNGDTDEHAELRLTTAWNRRAAKTPCDLCKFNPPSSMDGKPCTMCVADGRNEDV